MSTFCSRVEPPLLRPIRASVMSALLAACATVAMATEPSGDLTVVITPNCVACFRFEDLAINRGADLRPAQVGDLTKEITGSPSGTVSPRAIGQAAGNEQREAIPGAPGSFARYSLGDRLAGEDARYVAAEGASMASVSGENGVWIVQAKGLRAASGKRLVDAFVQRGYCDGPIVRVPTWQLHGADNRPVFLLSASRSFKPSDEAGLDVIRTALQALPEGSKAASICLGKLTPTLDLFDEAVRKKLDAALGRLEGAYSPDAIKPIVMSVLTQLLSSEEGRALLREALISVGSSLTEPSTR